MSTGSDSNACSRRETAFGCFLSFNCDARDLGKLIPQKVFSISLLEEPAPQESCNTRISGIRMIDEMFSDK